MRAALALALLAMVLFAAAPPAEAQGAPGSATTTEVLLGDFEGPVAPGGLASVKGFVRYTYFAPNGGPALVGTAVHLSFEAPEWATVALSPSTVIVPVEPQPPGLLVTVERPFTLQVHVTTDAPAKRAVNVRVMAEAMPNQLLAPSWGTSVVELRTGEACDEPDAMELQAVRAPERTLLDLALSPAGPVFGLASVGAVVGGRLGLRRLL